MKITAQLVFVVLCVMWMGCTQASRILAIFIVGSRSPKLAAMPILEELAVRGHQITLVSTFKSYLKEPGNIKEIVVSTDVEESFKEMDWFTSEKSGFVKILEMIWQLSDQVKQGYEDLVGNQDFISLLESKSVDVVIADAVVNEFAYVISDHLKVPLLLYCSGGALPNTLRPMGAEMDYASVPTLLNGFSNQMSFWQRMINMIQCEVLLFIYKAAVYWALDDAVKAKFPDVRPIEEIHRNASLLIINNHPATAWQRSLPPNVVSIGPTHVRPAKPLPQPLSIFADEATEGFIVFTLGSVVPVSSLPKHIIQTFLNVFAKLPLRVVWRWDAPIPDDTPSNIMMVKWLPQQDLLGHPKARLFITHGGLLGLQESMYHGVPLLGLPTNEGDQVAQVAKMTYEGSGLGLEWKSLTEEKLFSAMNRLIYDPSFKGNATRLSRLMRDELMPAKDIAAYWIEHVIRQGGSNHLQLLAAKQMPLYQRYLVDILSFLMLVIGAVLLGVLVLIRFIFRRCFRRSMKVKEN